MERATRNRKHIPTPLHCQRAPSSISSMTVSPAAPQTWDGNHTALEEDSILELLPFFLALTEPDLIHVVHLNLYIPTIIFFQR